MSTLSIILSRPGVKRKFATAVSIAKGKGRRLKAALRSFKKEYLFEDRAFTFLTPSDELYWRIAFNSQTVAVFRTDPDHAVAIFRVPRYRRAKKFLGEIFGI